MDSGAEMCALWTETAANMAKRKPFLSRLSTVNGIAKVMAQQCTVQFSTPLGKTFKVVFQTHPDLGYVKPAPYKILPYFRDEKRQHLELQKVNGSEPRKRRHLDMIIGVTDIHKFYSKQPVVYDTKYNPLEITSFSDKKDGGITKYETHWGTVWSGAFHSYKTYHVQQVNDLENRAPSIKKSELTFLNRINEEDQDDTTSVHYTTEDLNILWRRMIDLDRLPIDKQEQTMTEDELLAMKKIEQVMVLDAEKKRMHTRLLLRSVIRLNNNYNAVQVRMDAMYRNFNTKPQKFAERKKQYYAKMEEFFELGVLVKVHDPNPHLNDTNLKYYSPVCVVEKLTSLTSPHRLCVEANFKTSSGLSLNDNILPTPSLHLKIADIELRSRLGKYLVIADIKKLFLNLKIDNELDQDLLRVLYKPMDANQPSDPYYVYRYNSVIWGVADSPYQLNTALHKCVNYWLQSKQRTDFEKHVAKTIIRSLYVDDLTMAWNDKDDAIKAIDIANEIIAIGGFKFRKYLSNCSSILQHIPQADRAPYDVVLQKSYDQELEKMISKDAVQLGYRYSSRTDEFLFDRFTNIASTRNVYTKRGVSSCLASVFDALKLIGPFILSAKRVLKEAFRYGLDWNDDIRSLVTNQKVIEADKLEYIQSILQLWEQWIQDLQKLTELRFPRYICNGATSRYIIACDASTIGLCACCHVVTTENGVTTSNLVASICNITPLAKDLEKPLSIPLLELKAMLFSHDLAKWLEEEADIRHDQLTFISDSRVAIAWSLKPPERLLNHIALIVKKLQARKYVFKYVPTDLNSAADLGSRSCLYDGVASDVWKQGPEWYKLPYQEYPFHSHIDTAEKYRINMGLKKKFSILDSGNPENDQFTGEQLRFLSADYSIFNVAFEVSELFLEKNSSKISRKLGHDKFLCKSSTQKPSQCDAVSVCSSNTESCDKKGSPNSAIQHTHSTKKSSLLKRGEGRCATCFSNAEQCACMRKKWHKATSQRGKNNPDPLLRAVIKQLKAIQDRPKEDTNSKLTIKIPLLQYLGVTSWGFDKLIKHGAMIFTCVDKFKMKNSKSGRISTYRELGFSKEKPYPQSARHAELVRAHCKRNFPLITEESRRHAFLFYCQQSQARFYAEELQTLHGGQTAEVKLRSTIASLAPVLKRIRTGYVMCLTGRLNRDGGGANIDQLDEIVRHPPIIHRKSKLAMLLAKNEHMKTFSHAGSQQMANHLKRFVWIPAVKFLCRTIVKSCVRCQRTNARKHTQQMGNLPDPFIPVPSADKSPKPFEHTALDYTGYLTLKHYGKGKSFHYKVYLAIFYCLYTKAFQIEIVQSTDTPALLMAFDRLCHHRGRPNFLYSDQQPSFIKGNRIIRERISDINKHIEDLQQREKFEWKFGLSHNPQSLWESPIKMAKQSLARVLKTQIVDMQELKTLISRIQFTLNERPLQAEKQTSADSFSFISPHKLIYGMNLAVPDFDFGNTTVPLNNVDQKKSLTRLHTVLEHFRNVYNDYYLVSSQNRHFWRRKNQNINVHDLVLVRSFGSRKYEKRSRWNMGRIVVIHRSPRDQLVRRVDIKFADKTTRTYSVVDVYPLIDAENRKQQAEMLQEQQQIHDSKSCVLCTTELRKPQYKDGIWNDYAHTIH